MTITLQQYFGEFSGGVDDTLIHEQHAVKLLEAVNQLMGLAKSDGIIFTINPVTQSQISGAQYGGFRPQDCPIGALGSAHKTGDAVDIFDFDNSIDGWCLAHALPGGLLEQCGIYIENPESTPHWSHWTTRRPPSGHRVFLP